MLEEDLYRKIRLQRGAHAYFEARTRMLAMAWRIGFLAGPAIIAFLAIADARALSAIGIVSSAQRLA